MFLLLPLNKYLFSGLFLSLKNLKQPSSYLEGINNVKLYLELLHIVSITDSEWLFPLFIELLSANARIEVFTDPYIPVFWRILHIEVRTTCSNNITYSTTYYKETEPKINKCLGAKDQ